MTAARRFLSYPLGILVGMTDFALGPYAEGGLELARRANTPGMQTYLGGVEADAALVARHERILDILRTGRGDMFLIMTADGVAGSVGYWEKQWRDTTVYEMGWKVLPSFQGRGLAVAAVRAALTRAASTGRRTWAHAFPQSDNAASNAVCRKAGFTLLGECDFEFPAGTWITSNDWRQDLTSVSGSAAGSGSTSNRA